ncbi:MAG: ribosome maturation factor RimP [Anaerosomatales bacterium]|nr:ribosome maturation factor RimP [Anaerosomatales bacterium]GAV31302.1 ribosome maturation factor RimP [Coriobacteriaceae bacterium EMTCatB1]
MARDIAGDIERALAPLAEHHGLELVAVEVAGRAGKPVVRVFLDREGGIDLDAIAAANPWISEAIEETGAVEGSYVLEVSSPGVERPLRKPHDWERFAGRTAEVALTEPLGGRKKLTGVVAGYAEDQALLAVDGQTVAIPFSTIRKAHLAFDFSWFESKETR